MTNNQSAKTKRIMIFGRPGSGKSTFAHELHNITKIPLFHLDKYFYTSNWMQRDYVEFMEMQNEIVNKDAWIVDGNCTKSFETRYSRADLCLYFNYPMIVCLWRVCIRILQNRDHVDDRAEDCPEIVRWQLIKYMWTFEDRVKEKIAALRSKYPQVQFVECTNNKQNKRILKKIFLLNNLQLKQIEHTYVGLDEIIVLSIGNPTAQKTQQTIDEYNVVGTHMIGAFVNEKLVGIIGVMLEVGRTTVKHIAVLAEYRAMGIGEQLITYVANNFMTNKIIAETDEGSVGFYRALNFECFAFDGIYGRRYKCERTN